MEQSQIDLSFDFELGGSARSASAKLPVEQMDEPTPLMRDGVEGRMSSYSSWVVHRGRMWRPAVRGDLAVNLHDFGSLVEATKAIAFHRDQLAGEFALHGQRPMVADRSVIPGWIFYSSGSSLMVIPTIMDLESEPSSVASFVPASRGIESVRDLADEFGVEWTDEQDMFTESAIGALDDDLPPSPVAESEPSLARLEKALTDYFMDPTAPSAQAIHDAVDEHQSFLASSAARVMLR